MGCSGSAGTTDPLAALSNMLVRSLQRGRDATKGFPPFSFPQGRPWFVMVVQALLVVSSIAGDALAAQDTYRLAGIVAVGQDYVGFLELPQGGQVLVRTGSMVNGGRVTVLDDKVLTIQFPSSKLELQLQGSVSPSRPDPRDAVTEINDISDGAASIRTVDVGSLTGALTRTSPGAEAASAPSTALAQRFDPVLRLLPGARVVAIDEQPISTVNAAIKSVEASLEQGFVVRLTVESNSGTNRIYLRPQQPQKGN